MMRARVPGAEHYREIADRLREAAASCQFAGTYCISRHALKAGPIISTAGRDR
jgi:hypothetical protein